MNKSFFLALNHISGVGPRIALKLWERWPQLGELFNLSPQSLSEAGLPKNLISSILAFDLRMIVKDLEWENEAHTLSLFTF